jgi:signal transduction histidine kinase
VPDPAKPPELDAFEAISPRSDSMPIQEAKLQFLLRVSEELRRPLAVLAGYLEMIQDGTITEPQKTMPILVGKAAELNRLITEWLERARDEEW